MFNLIIGRQKEPRKLLQRDEIASRIVVLISSIIYRIVVERLVASTSRVHTHQISQMEIFQIKFIFISNRESVKRGKTGVEAAHPGCRVESRIRPKQAGSWTQYTVSLVSSIRSPL